MTGREGQLDQPLHWVLGAEMGGSPEPGVGTADCTKSGATKESFMIQLTTQYSEAILFIMVGFE